MNHEDNLEKLQQIKDIIEYLMWEEIDCDIEIPENIINHLALLHSDLKAFWEE